MKEIRPWTIKDSAELYNIAGWSSGYFRINDAGHVEATPLGTDGPSVDIHDLVLDLQRRGMGLPLLVRFSDILDSRVRTSSAVSRARSASTATRAATAASTRSRSTSSTTSSRSWCASARPYGLGLEAGSKPELLVGLALLDNPDALLILNGYKDAEYIETALLAQKLGRYPIIVIDRFRELELVLQVSRRLGIRPHIGVRAKLTTKGAGKWMESTGDRSKFGLTATEIVSLVDKLLREAQMLDCLELLHFHIGSQISAIRAIKDAMREATPRLRRAGARRARRSSSSTSAAGSASTTTARRPTGTSSMNYTMQEYANDVVAAILDACERARPAASRHRHRVGPRAGRAPLGAGVRRPRT